MEERIKLLLGVPIILLLMYTYSSDLSVGNKDDLRNYAKLQKSPRKSVKTNSDKR